MCAAQRSRYLRKQLASPTKRGRAGLALAGINKFISHLPSRRKRERNAPGGLGLPRAQLHILQVIVVVVNIVRRIVVLVRGLTRESRRGPQKKSRPPRSGVVPYDTSAFFAKYYTEQESSVRVLVSVVDTGLRYVSFGKMPQANAEPTRMDERISINGPGGT